MDVSTMSRLAEDHIVEARKMVADGDMVAAGLELGRAWSSWQVMGIVEGLERERGISILHRRAG